VDGKVVKGIQEGRSFGTDARAGLRKDGKDLKATFDKAIQDAVSNSTMNRLAEEWFAVDVTSIAQQ